MIHGVNVLIDELIEGDSTEEENRKSFILLLDDITNAFGSPTREALLTAIKFQAPEFENLFLSIYAHENKILLR